MKVHSVYSTGRSMVWSLVALMLGLGAPAAFGAATPIRVLIITGIDWPGHLWKLTTPALQDELAKDPRMRVEVLEDPYRLDQTDLAHFDALILHFMNWEKPEPNPRAKENLRGFVERGGGLVSIHFACGAFSNWTEYASLIGRVWDGTNTHDPRGVFQVDMVNRQHPLTRGLEPSFLTDDELYICLTGSKPVEVLATARSKLTRRDHPMALVHTYGKGRVFLTPLGHDVRALRSPGTAELLRRGVAWTARRDPVPSGSFPASVGPWEGSARIIVSWCQQTNLPVRLHILADGSVTGQIGDAQLADGRFERNRGWLGRQLQLKTDYIVTGRLEGAMVVAEDIRRARVMIPLNYRRGAFIGGLHTSGWMAGGKQYMKFSAAGLVLRQTNAPVAKLSLSP